MTDNTARDAAWRAACAASNVWPYDLRAVFNAGWDAALRARPEPATLSVADVVRDFAQAVLHGDEEHRAWLLEAAEAFLNGDPMPPPRSKDPQ